MSTPTLAILSWVAVSFVLALRFGAWMRAIDAAAERSKER